MMSTLVWVTSIRVLNHPFFLNMLDHAGIGVRCDVHLPGRDTNVCRVFLVDGKAVPGA